MTDLATLGVRVHGEGIVQTTGELNAFSKSAHSAEAAARGTAAASSQMSVALRQQQAVMKTVQNAGLGMTRQFSDIGVSLASGVNPLMVFIQQGPQIADIFQQARMQGVGFNAMLAGMNAQLAPVMAILSPLVVVVGALSAAWGLATREMNKGNEDLSKGLGLTEKQMERLKKEGVDTGVTMGDSFRAFGTTFKEVMQEAFGPQLDWVSRQFSGFLDDLTKNTVNELKAIAGGFTGTYYAIRAVWSQLPAVINDMVITAANAVVRGLEWAINRGVAGINALRRHYNTLPDWMRSGQTAPVMGNVSLGGFSNMDAGAARQAGADAAAAFRQGMAAGRASVDSFGARWAANARDSARARIRGEAGAPGAEEAARKAREVVEQLRGFERINLSPLRGAFFEILDPLKIMADELRLVNGLANETANNMAAAFGNTGKVLGDLLTTMTGYQSRMAEIALAQQEFRLTGAQADRERAQAQIQSYGDMAAAAKGFFKEGTDGYRVLQAAEQAYRLIQFAGAVRAIVLGGQETAVTVAQNGIRAASHGVVAVARALASLPFPFNLAAGAATVAALAAIGVRLAGGSGSSQAARVSASVSNVQSQPSRGAQQGPWSQTVNVRVIPNDDRFDAYVDTRVQPQATAAYRASTRDSRSIIPADQSRRDRFKLGKRSPA